MRQRLGIYGGSFDPIHYGHLLLAESCLEQCRLDQVWLLPASVPPHKRSVELTSDQHRIAMIKLAVGGHESLTVSTLETDRGGVSYTVDTLAAIRNAFPEADLFILMGADTLCDLSNWYEPQKICELAIPVAVRRRGWPEPDFTEIAKLVSSDRLDEIRANQAEMPPVDFASTDLRGRVDQGKSIRFRTPRSVEKYIETHCLYRSVDADTHREKC